MTGIITVTDAGITGSGFGICPYFENICQLISRALVQNIVANHHHAFDVLFVPQTVAPVPRIFGTVAGVSGQGNRRIIVGIIGRVRDYRSTELFQIGKAPGSASAFSGLLEGGEKQCRKNRDNCNYNEELNKGKAVRLYPNLLG